MRPLTPLARAAVTLLTGALALAAFQAAPASPRTGQAQEQKAQDQKAPELKASMEGTVLDAPLSKPLKDVTVLLVRSTGTGTPASAKTDEAGHFLFKNLDAGSYVLIGDHPRFARQSYGSRNGLLGGTLLTLSTAQEMKDITFKLQPNAVASGKVVDEDGEPLPNVMVAALKGMYARGTRQFLPLGTAMTNDLGEYRIGNLAAGRYLLSATLLRQGDAAKPAGDAPEEAYLLTYYPNVTESSSAAPVEVTAGGDAAGLNIRLAKAKSVRIKGKVMGAAADQQVTVRLVPKDAGLLALITGRNARTDKSDATFEITGATPGSYTLRVTDQTGMKTLGPPLPLEIGERRIENIVLNVAPAAELAGLVTVEGSDNAAAGGVPLKGARILLESLESLVVIPPTANVAGDGTFTLKDLPPGKYLVRLFDGPPSCYVRSVRAGSQEMTEQGLDLGGAAAGKLDIKLRPGGAQVDGVIRGQDDNPISGVTVALIPDSKQYLLYQSTFTDQNGAFSFKSVTPGEYKVLAWEDVEPNAFQDPEFVKPFEGMAEAVSLKEKDRKGVTIKAIPRR